MQMTYGEFYNSVVRSLHLKGKVDDYRPTYITPETKEVNGEITNNSYQIPEAITITLKNGDKIVYILRKKET